MSVQWTDASDEWNSRRPSILSDVWMCSAGHFKILLEKLRAEPEYYWVIYCDGLIYRGLSSGKMDLEEAKRVAIDVVVRQAQAVVDALRGNE